MRFGQKICKEHCQLHVPFTGEVWQKVVRDIIWNLGLLCTYIITFSYFLLLYLILFLIFALRIKMRPLSAKLEISSFLYTAIRFHRFYYVFIKEYVIMKMWRIQMTSSPESPGGDWDFGNFTLGSAICSPEEGTWIISDARQSVNKGN